MLWSQIARREMEPISAVRAGHRAMGIDLDSAQAEAVANLFYEAMRTEGRAAPDARAALIELRRAGYRLGIISNTITPPGALDRHLEEEGLLEFFSERVYSCEVRYVKPDPRIFDIALRRVGGVASRSAYVGDKENIDVKGASRLGMLTVLKRPDGSPVSRRWKPDHVIRGLAELPAVLRTYSTDVHSADSADGAGRL
jgi:HAD superfamily hydrolase (TIGR01549 family)